MTTGVSAVRRQIGVGLRRVCDALDVSQLELGRQMGVSGPSVNVWMSGEARLPLERLPEIAHALSKSTGLVVSADLLLYEMGLTEREPLISLEELAAELIRRGRTEGNTSRTGGETPPADGVLPPASALAMDGSGRFLLPAALLQSSTPRTLVLQHP
jgi:transcriptional regulator with XRE-family HTH domain